MNKEIREIILGFKRTLYFLQKPEKIMLGIAVVLMLINGFLTNLPALILGKLVDQIIQTNNFSFTIILPSLVLIIIFILTRESLNVIRKYFIENIKTQTEKKQTLNAVGHLLKVDLSYLNEQQIGSLHGKIFRSIQGLTQLIKLGFLEFFPIFFAAFSAIILSLFQKPILASIMILVIPIGLWIILRQISSQKGIRVFLLRGKEQIDGKVVEVLGGIETVRVLNTTQYELNRIEQIAETLRKKEIKHHIAMAFFDAAKYLNEGFFYILTISLAIFFAAQGIISRGDILVYSILFLSITAPLREIHRILDQAHESSILVSDLYDILKKPQDVSFNQTDKMSKPSATEITLTLKNISFHYPQKTELILKGINLEIKKGEKVGIAGASGSGKSTLVKILLKLIHGYEGDIFIYGENLKNVSRETIAQKITYIPQDPYVFSGTIEENIIYGNSETISKERLIDATKKAHIFDEIEQSLGGFNGIVAERGKNLSGGQKQRLVLARLMLTSPEIIIFDEATSALDNINEIKIQQNIEKVFKDKTVITIAHRLSTLKNSDRVLVFDQGTIHQEGTYEKLASKKGLFQDFLKQNPDTK